MTPQEMNQFVTGMLKYTPHITHLDIANDHINGVIMLEATGKEKRARAAIASSSILQAANPAEPLKHAIEALDYQLARVEANCY